MLVKRLRRTAAAVRKIGCPVALVVRIEGDKGPVLGSLCRYASAETTATAIEKKPRSTASSPDRTSMLAIEQVASLLEVFRGLHHHVNVPYAFVVPAEEPWPHELHGERLGRRIEYLRRMKDRLSPAQLRQLDSVGMVWSDEEYQVGRIERGLTTYKAMYGDVRVPKVFEVPHGDDRWDRDLWDMKLGRTINVVRNTGAYEAYRYRFEALGLTFDRWNGPPFTVVQKERDQHGHYEVSMAEAGDTWGTVWAST